MAKCVPGLGLAVGLSLALTITIACAIGYLIPYSLIRMGFDQAAGSDSFGTTIKDMSAWPSTSSPCPCWCRDWWNNSKGNKKSGLAELAPGE